MVVCAYGVQTSCSSWLQDEGEHSHIPPLLCELLEGDHGQLIVKMKLPHAWVEGEEVVEGDGAGVVEDDGDYWDCTGVLCIHESTDVMVVILSHSQLFVFSGFCFLEVVQMLTVPHSRPLCKTFETQAW